MRRQSDAWRTFLLCHDRDTCVHKEHVKWAKERYKRFMAAPTLFEAATIAHYRCDMWAQASHGGTFITAAERYCGKNAVRHIVCLANKPWLIDMWTAQHAPAEPVGVVCDELALFP